MDHLQVLQVCDTCVCDHGRCHITFHDKVDPVLCFENVNISLVLPFIIPLLDNTHLPCDEFGWSDKNF